MKNKIKKREKIFIKCEKINCFLNLFFFLINYSFTVITNIKNYFIFGLSV